MTETSPGVSPESHDAASKDSRSVRVPEGSGGRAAPGEGPRSAKDPAAATEPRATTRGIILRRVSQERDRQDAKWGGEPGVERRDDHTYAAVLGEEFGEACKAWLERDTLALREELIHVAAVAVAWVEELDNGGGIVRAV